MHRHQFFTKNRRQQTTTANHPLRDNTAEASSVNYAHISEQNPSLTRSNSNLSNRSHTSSIFGSSSNRVRPLSIKKSLKEHLQHHIAPHLKDDKSPAEMARLRITHATLIDNLQKYRNIIGEANSGVNLSDEQLQEKDDLIDNIYQAIEQIVIASAPRQTKKQVASIEGELKILAQDSVYSGKDEQAQKTAIVNSFAYIGQKFIKVSSDNPPFMPIGMAALMYKGNTEISDLYRAITNKSLPLDKEIINKVEMGVTQYAKNRNNKSAVAGGAVGASGAIAGIIFLFVTRGVDVAVDAFAGSIMSLLGAAGGAGVGFILGDGLSEGIGNIARKKRVASDKSLHVSSLYDYDTTIIPKNIMSERQE